MAITALFYEPPIRRNARRPTLDYEQLERAVELADSGSPLASIERVLAHLFPGRAVPDLRKERFVFVQGSSHVSLRIDGDDVTVTVPLVRLPSGGKAIAAMRHILNRLAGSGQLYQPRLRGDDVTLEYRDRLVRTHPAKIVEVLQRMPLEADEHDDFLVGQFAAEPLDRAPVAALGADEEARATEIWAKHWGEIDELLPECRRKRSMFFLNELTAYALHRIAFTLPLNGFLGSRLREHANVFNDTNEDPLRREASLAKCVKDMKGVSPEELHKSLNHAEYAVSRLHEGSPKALGNYLGEDYRERIEDLIKAGKPMDAALGLVGTYTFLLSVFSWPDGIERELKAGLAKISGKPFRETAKELFEHAKSIADRFADESDDSGDGDDGDDGDAENGNAENGDKEDES